MTQTDELLLASAFENLKILINDQNNKMVSAKGKEISRVIKMQKFGFSFEGYFEYTVEGLSDVISSIWNGIVKVLKRIAKAITDFLFGESKKNKTIFEMTLRIEKKLDVIYKARSEITKKIATIAASRDSVDNDLYQDVTDKKINIKNQHCEAFMASNGHFDTSVHHMKTIISLYEKKMAANEVFDHVLAGTIGVDPTRADLGYWENLGHFTTDGSKDGIIVKKYKDYLKAISDHSSTSDDSVFYTVKLSEIKAMDITFKQSAIEKSTSNSMSKNASLFDKVNSQEQHRLGIITIEEIKDMCDTIIALSTKLTSSLTARQHIATVILNTANKLDSAIKAHKLDEKFNPETMAYVKMVYMVITGFVQYPDLVNYINSFSHFCDECIDLYYKILNVPLK